MYLWYVRLSDSQVAVQQAPQKSGSNGPGKVLTEAKEKLSGQGP